MQRGAELWRVEGSARSILADPRDDTIREAINAKIKKRELFRPFAPSTTVEAAAEFFELDQQSPYMNILATVRPERRGMLSNEGRW